MSNEPITSVTGFLTHVKNLQPTRFIYRGMKDAKHAVFGIMSSAAVRVSKGLKISDLMYSPFLGYIHQIIDEAKLNYPNTYKGLSPLEIMAHLQHNRVATGLIDFTYNPLVALWFACEDDTTEGKVIMLDTQQKLAGEEIQQIKTTDELKKDLETFFNIDSDQWFLWQPTIGNANIETQRLTMQQSVFLFGDTVLPHDSYQEFQIPAASKKGIKAELESLSITDKQLFSDLAGFMERNTIAHDYDGNLAEHFYTQKIKNHGNEASKTQATNYFFRGNFRASIGQYDAAILDYDMAIKADPDNVYVKAVVTSNKGYANIIMGHHAITQNDYALARKQYAAARKDYALAQKLAAKLRNESILGEVQEKIEQIDSLLLKLQKK